MDLRSPAFLDQQYIPRKYSCQGDDVSPPLEIADFPEGTVSLCLIMDDPDAPMGTWDHWLVWNLPPTTEIPEGSLPEGASEGVNSWGNNNYGGPCPPSGTHRYFFKLYALDQKLDLPSSTKKEELEAALKPHLLDEAILMGLYTKS